VTHNVLAEQGIHFENHAQEGRSVVQGLIGHLRTTKVLMYHWSRVNVRSYLWSSLASWISFEPRVTEHDELG